MFWMKWREFLQRITSKTLSPNFDNSEASILCTETDSILSICSFSKNALVTWNAWIITSSLLEFLHCFCRTVYGHNFFENLPQFQCKLSVSKAYVKNGCGFRVNIVARENLQETFYFGHFQLSLWIYHNDKLLDNLFDIQIVLSLIRDGNCCFESFVDSTDWVHKQMYIVEYKIVSLPTQLLKLSPNYVFNIFIVYLSDF